ncbi:hypothetical protein ACQ4PT_059787 [Festuca glaucescens]
MASHSPPPPPPPAPTTINALTDDLLREIFLRLPDLPSLACAAFSCRAFLRAVRSSPGFRRRFRELHAPPILALFIEPYMRAIVPAVSHMADTGITAAFADLLRDDGSSEWIYHPEAPYSDGYVFFINRNTEQIIFYKVHTQALNIYTKKSHVGVRTFLEFHTLPAECRPRWPEAIPCGLCPSRSLMGVGAPGRLLVSCHGVAVDNGGIERFMLYKTFPLHTSLKEVTKGPAEDIVDVGSQLIMAIDGFVYLSVVYNGDPQSWFVSVCLETAEVKFLFKRACCSSCFDPYIMAWPPAMIDNKDDSETEVTGDSVGDNGRVGIEDASPVLFTALRSFKEALIDDGNAKFVYYMDSFLLDDEVNSLLNKISNLDAGLAAARDRVLKIGAHSDIKKEGIERESWWRMCKGVLRRARPSCFAS